jgi:hypothetical protein
MSTLSTQAQRREIGDLRQLLRLRELREEAARRAHETCRVARDEALRAVRDREALLQQQRAELGVLSAYVAGDGAGAMPRLCSYASARRELLDDRIERNEYGLIDDEEALAEAERRLQLASEAWAQARARTQAVETLRDSTRRRAACAAEQRAEREVEMPLRAAAGRMVDVGGDA